MKNPYDQLNNSLLTECGLNMQAVFRVADLPGEIGSQMEDGSLLLLGNGGTRFWQALTSEVWDSTDPEHCHPIDRRSVEVAQEYMRQSWPDRRYRVLYPSTVPVGLQQLGRLAGWHSDSPLKVGINPVFGLWYAYRVLLWVEGELPLTHAPRITSPCESCEEKPCIKACPADALSESPKSLDACIDYRLSANSPCQFSCLARLQCPVAVQHRYSPEQVRYHYQQSYETLVCWRK